MLFKVGYRHDSLHPTNINVGHVQLQHIFFEQKSEENLLAVLSVGLTLAFCCRMKALEMQALHKSL